jgi:protein gp37
MKNSHIEWTDHTFNPWEGCTKVSPGCANCYAETRNKRWNAGKNWGPGAPRRRTSASNWNEPVKWNREAEATGTRPRVFCASLADWLDDEVPIEWLADLLVLIHKTPHLDWLLLTKRPENWKSRMEAVCEFDGDSLAWSWLRGNALHNVWLGTTVEDQKRADQRIPRLLSIPARVRFLSCEPLLGPVDLWCANYRSPDGSFTGAVTTWKDCGVNWVICGGESGPGARPMHPDWAIALRDECNAARVPFFFKQWGEWLPVGQDAHEIISYGRHEMHSFSEDVQSYRVGKRDAGRLLDGKEHSGLPVPATL